MPKSLNTTDNVAHQAQLVGRKIRQLRKERKLTQTALAGRIGIQQSDLSRMEKGEYRVSLDTLFRILAEFDVTLAEFFHEDESESYSPKDMLFVRQFNTLPKDAQDEVKAFISFKSSSSRDTSGGNNK
ncbi:MAG: helix-turn-helix transcriptional regulator [Acidobacteriota bacterium]|nr:helix-turn-helix transcriptional regulator [Acidobacteriota bacterium]